MELQHISASSVLLFLNNPAAWHSKYVLGIRDQKSTPAALTGSAFHKYMEGLHKGIPREQAQEVALAFMNSVTEADYGKTGSLEKCQINFNQLVEHFHREKPKVGKVLGVEHAFLEKIPGIKLPIKAFVDLIHEEGQSLVLTDWKTVSAFEDEPTPAQILHACFYYFVVQQAWKQTPVRFDIVQIKATWNTDFHTKKRDGSPQIRTNSIDFLLQPFYLKGIKELAKRTVIQMTRKKQPFLPNLRDDYEGEAEFNRFLAIC